MPATIEASADRIAVTGAMTFDTASELLARGVAALAQGTPSFDLAAVDAIDSSGLAVIFGWQRAALKQDKALRIVSPPQSLLSLASVYGVTELLPLN
jgi:phospholipid transport system transporter-binding protein